MLVGIAHSHPSHHSREVEVSFSTFDVGTFEREVKINKDFSFYLRTVYGNVLKLDKNSYSLGVSVQTPMKRPLVVKAGNSTYTFKVFKRFYGHSICKNRKTCLPVYGPKSKKVKPWVNPG